MTQPPIARRSALVPTVIIAVVVVYAWTLVAGLWTDNLWFRSIGFGTVFSTQLFTAVGLFVVFGGIMTGVLGLMLLLAWRHRPGQGVGAASPLLDQYRELLTRRTGLLLLIPAAFVGLIAGMSASGQTALFLAWRSSTPFGTVDPYFGTDIAFYVFEYPWWRFLNSFVLTGLVVIILATVALHFTLGALGAGPLRRRMSTKTAQVQLSLLFAAALVSYGIDNLLDRYGFALDGTELLTGVTYTDDNARMTARLIVAVIAFICAGLFVLNAFWRRWATPLVAVVLMVLSGLILSLIYPAIVQSFDVRPDEPDKERPYIEKHISATRDAYGLNDVEISDYSAKTTVSPGQLKQDAEVLPGIRLIDPAIVAPTFEQLQQVRGYYSFPSVLDVDRYTIDGLETDVVVAARQLDQNGLPDANWNNIHTVYTHGYGLVIAYGNKRQSGGEPVWISGDIPPVGILKEDQPRIYFGELETAFAVVGREAGQPPIELDTPGGGSGGGETNNTYDGKGGVAIGNLLVRGMYATRFGDINLLLSDRVNSQSKILYDRSPRDRVQKVAPWLTVDSNTFPAIVDGRIVWIVDAYTTSTTYPNSQRISLNSAISDTVRDMTGLETTQTVNYMRNSVKAVVDAYDGSVSLYAWEPDDPILQTWMKVFPDTVKSRDEISPDLLNHLRYPEDLFKVQRSVLGRYHMTNPDTWYKQSDLWTVPVDPVKGSNSIKEPSYYLSIKWPGDEDAVFSQTTVFVPNARQNLAAYMAVNADAANPDYGKIRILRMSDTQQIDGPSQTFNAMTTNATVAEQLRPFLNQGSAAATYGNLLTLPLGGGLLYVEPIYTERQAGTSGAYPALAFVVVRFGEYVAIGNTLQEALDRVFSGSAGATTGEGGTGTTKPTPPPTGTGKVDQAALDQALADAQSAFAAAETALKAGDLAGYQSKINDAKAAIARAWTASGR